MSIARFNTWSSTDSSRALSVHDVPTTSEVQALVDDAIAGIPGGGGGGATDASVVTYTQAGASASARNVQNRLRERVSIRDFGAVGDGIADDTAALQAALTYAATIKACVRLPAGRFRLTSTINIPSSETGIVGDGYGSILAWDHAGHVFNCTAQAAWQNMERFKILSVSVKNPATVAYVFNYAEGIIKSNFRDLYLDYDRPNVNTAPWGLFSSDYAKTQDMLTFDNIEIDGISGIGYNIRSGSSIWVSGGRVIGLSGFATTSVGMQLNGNMGGIWVWGTDFIALGTGFWATNGGAGTNREIFLSQACCDTCGVYGFRFSDNSYVSSTGIWAASCELACVQVDSTFGGTLNISGGTVFNGGANGPGVGDGLVINAGGRVILSGVTLRHNKGYGIRCTVANAPTFLLMSGCTVHNNANNSIGGTKVRVNGCMIETNTNALQIVSAAGNCRVTNTTGVNDTLNVVTPSVPASGQTVTNTTHVPVTVYLTGGSVNGVYINGNWVLGVPNTTHNLSPGDTIMFTHTGSSPLWTWIRADM